MIVFLPEGFEASYSENHEDIVIKVGDISPSLIVIRVEEITRVYVSCDDSLSSYEPYRVMIEMASGRFIARFITEERRDVFVKFLRGRRKVKA